MAKVQTTCIKCGAGLESRLFCFSCKTIQPFTESNLSYFEVFGLSKEFEIDETDLEVKYQNLSFELHPDFFESAAESEKNLSEKASAILNTAYKTLSEPSSRALYLLNLFSLRVKLDERSLPEGFLGEMFFLQEKLDELLEYENESELSILKNDLIRRQKKIEAKFTLLFRKIEKYPNDSENLQELQTNLNAEKYLYRLLERIN